MEISARNSFSSVCSEACMKKEISTASYLDTFKLQFILHQRTVILLGSYYKSVVFDMSLDFCRPSKDLIMCKSLPFFFQFTFILPKQQHDAHY